jgi:hypothetical protein
MYGKRPGGTQREKLMLLRCYVRLSMVCMVINKINAGGVPLFP